MNPVEYKNLKHNPEGVEQFYGCANKPIRQIKLKIELISSIHILQMNGLRRNEDAMKNYSQYQKKILNKKY